jgi:hypothetical protein
MSETTTLKPADEKLPRASVAVHDTGVVPIENELPELGVQATTTGSLTPLTSGGAEMLKTTFTVEELAVDPRTSVSGPNPGAVVSSTITLKESTSIEGSLSSVHVTRVAPIGNREFGAGLHVVPAATGKFTFAPAELVASALMLGLASQCMAEAAGVSTSAKTTVKRARRKANPSSRGT